MDALMKIQQELKAPKNQFNSFGKYKYRSCEDILEAVKPLLSKYTAQLTLSDEIVQIGDRVYVKATASITDGLVITEVTAYAREPIEKKGMDESQITGTASSYARKYALNGLFLIDDTKDADTDEYKNTQQNSPKNDVISPLCPVCGKPVKGFKRESGEVVTGETVLRQIGMCLDCNKKRNEAENK